MFKLYLWFYRFYDVRGGRVFLSFFLVYGKGSEVEEGYYLKFRFYLYWNLGFSIGF